MKDLEFFTLEIVKDNHKGNHNYCTFVIRFTFHRMQLNSLSILGFKNIQDSQLQFSPKINCFIGDNGMGKTNMLDAIYLLSFCKSQSSFNDIQNINHDAEFAVIQGFYERCGEVEEIFCGLKRRQKKQFKRNKKEYERLSEHIGLIPLVMVSPDDNNLILEGSSERRKLIDGVISQYNKTYLQYLLQYNNILKQRNILLKQDNPDETILDIWDKNLCELGKYIFIARTTFIEEFIPVFRNFYENISGGLEEVTLSYSSDHQKHPDLYSHMKLNRNRDKMLGYTTHGIHKDELDMMLGNFPIRQVGSQGQCKTYLIALKFAQFDFLKKIHGFSPLLLLDDIFDKLDVKRVQQIVNLVASDLFGQIFITDTNREHLDQILLPLDENSKIFRIKNGSIV